MSPVQQQLSEINHRYSLLGVKLTDRQTELESVREEVKKNLENLRNLSQFLDKVQRQMPKEFVPMTRDDSDKAARAFKVPTIKIQKFREELRNIVNKPFIRRKF